MASEIQRKRSVDEVEDLEKPAQHSERVDKELVQHFSWLTTCIYLAILVVEYPQNWLIARVPIAKYLSFCVVAWELAWPATLFVKTSRAWQLYMMNGAQQIVGGLLAYCFSLIKTGPLKSWQEFFLSHDGPRYFIAFATHLGCY
ncbi:allantoate permease [Fusarium sp. NRRL 52700]|nr:allantoate permease [Fusarium sp. NRRL 52700]